MGLVSAACIVDYHVSVDVFVFVYEHVWMSVWRGFTVALVLWTQRVPLRKDG